MNPRLNPIRIPASSLLAQPARGFGRHRFAACKWAALGAALIAALALAPTTASANGRHGHSAYRGGYSGHYVQPRYYQRGGYRHGGHWNGGRWIAGAIVTGAVIGLVNQAMAPPPVYYAPPVVYAPPQVIYRDGYAPPVVTRRVVQSTTVVYGDPYQTRYIRSDW